MSDLKDEPSPNAQAPSPTYPPLFNGSPNPHFAFPSTKTVDSLVAGIMADQQALVNRINHDNKVRTLESQLIKELLACGEWSLVQTPDDEYVFMTAKTSQRVPELYEQYLELTKLPLPQAACNALNELKGADYDAFCDMYPAQARVLSRLATGDE